MSLAARGLRGQNVIIRDEANNLWFRADSEGMSLSICNQVSGNGQERTCEKMRTL